MSEDLFQMLLKLRGPDKASGGSELENMGKQAADKWLEGHADSLSDAVVQTVKSAGLTQEQVKRVIEFTNIEAYNREFKKESASKVIDFAGGPADPVFVLKDLNEGGGSMTTDHHSSDYDTPPGEKTASVDRSKWHPVDRAQDAANAEWEVQMHEHGDKKKADAAAAAAGRKHLPDYDHGFNYLGKHKPGSPEHAKQQAALKHKAPSEKTAHVNLRHEREFEQMFATTGGEYPEVNPLGDVMDLRDKLASQFDNMTSEIGSLEVEFLAAAR